MARPTDKELAALLRDVLPAIEQLVNITEREIGGNAAGRDLYDDVCRAADALESQPAPTFEERVEAAVNDDEVFARFQSLRADDASTDEQVAGQERSIIGEVLRAAVFGRD